MSRESLEAGTAQLFVSQLLFQVMEARDPTATYSDMHCALTNAALPDEHHCHLGVQFLQQLASIDSTSVAVGVDQVTSGPVFDTLLDYNSINQDTDLSCHQSIILNLIHIPSDSQLQVLEAVRQAAALGTKIIILQQSVHICTPDQLAITNNIKIWATSATRITSRCAIWQPHHSWKNSKPKPSCWKGIVIWVAGQREGRVDKIVRVLQHSSQLPDSPLTKVYVNAIQGTQYVTQGHLLAATDCSMKKDGSGDSKMGGGYCFSEGGPASKSFQVGGDAASLRAEAAAMWQVLISARTIPTRSLVILCDSLGLLQMLRGYHRKDYQYHPHSYTHFDIIKLILEELNARKAAVHLVKVKSHVGIELNERADVLANEGLLSDEVLCNPPRNIFPLWITQDGSSVHLGKAALFKEVRAQHHAFQCKVLLRTAGITTQNFLQDCLGQQFHSKAGKMLQLGNLRLWLLSKGDCYPTQYYSYCTGQASNNTCTMPGCVRRETYNHCVCSCKVVSSAAHALHDRVWRGVFNVIKSSVPPGTRVVYDSAIGTIPGIKSSKVIDKLQPDGVVIWGDFTAIDLLEFTHTGDLWPDSLTAARDKKPEADKYLKLVAELQLLYPEVVITIVPFVVGARSYMDEKHWGQSWTKLQLPPAALKKIYPKVQVWNVEAACEMLVVRAALRKGVG